jgi:hypothetical protein
MDLIVRYLLQSRLYIIVATHASVMMPPDGSSMLQIMFAETEKLATARINWVALDNGEMMTKSSAIVKSAATISASCFLNHILGEVV